MESMKPRISVEYVDDATIVSFADEKILDGRDVEAVENAVMSVVEQADRIKLILDFGNVEFLSSAVLGFLIRVSKKVYEDGGQLGFCCINPKIYEIFKITRLTNVFDNFEDKQTALKGLSGRY